MIRSTWLVSLTILFGAAPPDRAAAVRDAIVSVRDAGDFGSALHQIAAACPDDDLEKVLLRLASQDPALAPGTSHRNWLIMTLVRMPLSGRHFRPFSSPTQDFLLKELRTVSSEVNAVILGAMSRFSAENHADLREASWNLLQASDYVVVVGALRVLSALGEPDPQAADVLRRWVVEPELSVHPEIVADRAHYAPFDAWHSIRVGAASSLLMTSVNLAEDIAWLRELGGDAALAARAALFGGAAPEQRFEMLDQGVQQQWMSALLDTMRSTLAQSPLTQDEFAVLVSLGERFPQFRQDVGDFLQERLDAGVRDPHQAAGTRQVLERWSKTP